MLVQKSWLPNYCRCIHKFYISDFIHIEDIFTYKWKENCLLHARNFLTSLLIFRELLTIRNRNFGETLVYEYILIK
jgi:hypothetical protein